jgi:hypothetical protein
MSRTVGTIRHKEFTYNSLLRNKLKVGWFGLKGAGLDVNRAEVHAAPGRPALERSGLVTGGVSGRTGWNLRFASRPLFSGLRKLAMNVTK